MGGSGAAECGGLCGEIVRGESAERFAGVAACEGLCGVGGWPAGQPESGSGGQGAGASGWEDSADGGGCEIGGAADLAASDHRESSRGGRWRERGGCGGEVD